MKKISTPKPNQMKCKTSSPTFKTLEFIRQFARSYKAVELSERVLCGFSMN